MRTSVLSRRVSFVLRVLNRKRFHCILLFFHVDRLLLSIDRRQSLFEASDTIKLAQEYALSSSVLEQGKVVGIDLSGDPNVSLTIPVCHH